MYNAYIPNGTPYEKIPEDQMPPGSDTFFPGSWGPKLKEALSGLLGKFKRDTVDSGDLLLLLILFLLLKEEDHSDALLLLGLAALFFLGED